MSDARNTYILGCAQAALGVSNLPSSPLISSFLDASEYATLQVTYDSEAEYSSELKPAQGKREVHFVKTVPKPLGESEIQECVVMGTLGQDPVSSLLRSIKAVAQPILSSSSADSRLQNLLTELEAGLNSIYRTGPKGDSLEYIFLPNDEFEYWDSQRHEQAKVFSDHFSRISRQWSELSTLTFSELQDLLEETLDVLDIVWRENFPQPRMDKLFNVMAEAICRKVQNALPNSELWGGELADVCVKLREGLNACERWIEIMQELAQNYWRAERPWQGQLPKSDQLMRFSMRVEEVLNIRTQHDELLRLLSSEELKAFNVSRAFDPFRKMQVLHVSPYTDQKWQDSKAKYDSNMSAIEQEISNKLEKEVLEDSNPAQKLRDFQKWKGLLSRPNISKALHPQREHLLDQLIVHVESMTEQFNSKSDIYVDPNMSPLVSSVIWARQIQNKISKLISSAASLFTDLPNLSKLKQMCESLNKKLNDYQKQQFRDWKTEVERSIQDPNDPLALEITGRMMELDLKDGLLKVGYSDKLVQLLKETRQLSEYGFPIPKSFKKIAMQGKKYYKEAITLKQVANFYNNMSSQIIDSQKRLLLDAAIHFEEEVKSAQNMRNGTVTWQNPVEVEEYIQKVQKAATDLMTENRRLRKAHFEIIEQIGELQNIDLLRNRSTWKEKLDGIRREIDSVTEGKDEEAARSWKAALDKELYKSLEVQYKYGLDNLNQNLPEIKADLAFLNKTLQFRPPLEELKSKFYKEIRNFISIPNNFQGLGGNPEVYRKMPDKNSDGLLTLYSKAEELFKELKETLEIYKPWVVLGKVNIETLVEENLKEVVDWEHNFRVLKQKRKEVEKLAESHKVHCFYISTTPLKAAIEDQLQRFSDALVVSLKTTLRTDTQLLEEFLKTAQTKLTARPQNVDEISKAQSEALEVANQKEEMQTKYQGLQDKTKLLKQLTGTGPNLSGVTDKWENFNSSLETFGEVIEQQREVVKQDIANRTEDLSTALEKFASRWQALKPKPLDEIDMESAIEQAERVKEWRNDWQALKDQISKLKEECSQFSMPVPDFDIQEVESEITETESSWGLFEEFRQDLDKMAEEDWFSFRSRLYNFQDFFLNWSEKLKARSKDPVSRFMSSQIESYKRAWPLLKLITGEGFEKEHWKTLFHYLKLPKEVTVENLKFKHFLDSVHYLIASADQVKELQARAQGEVTIREAIQELRVWCDEATFTLFEHVQNDRVTPLIKEWKEILTQVSDNQALLSSLKESRFFYRFEDQVSQFESKLSALDEYLAKLSVIQRKWVYLEPIFGRGALPQEQGRFKRVDEEYRAIMLGLGSDSRVITLTNIPGLKDTLENLLDQLDRCQKALNDFLEEKRSKFPRFYFIGDDDLLEILGQSHNTNVIQTHLKKLFAGIHKVEIQNDQITAFLSSAGEKVEMDSKVSVKDEVEGWLDRLSKEMVATLSKKLVTCLQSPDLSSIMQSQPSQLISLSQLVRFSEDCSKAIQSGNLSGFKQSLTQELTELTSQRVTDPLLLLKIKSLVLDQIHNIEVVESLIQKAVGSQNDWEWHRQLKFFMGKNKKCLIQMCEAQFNYTYEYQGNAPKLVHTPLTDKCYLTLTQGMMMGYGGNPYGPAGTGKTESVKALGQAFGRQVLVFNCDEGIDFKSMGRIFIGLVKCGAWGCFDEFNRLLEEQLSAISQQIQVIQWAIKAGEKTLELLGRTIEVNHNAGIFVTMNPAGKGYGGRSKLPDNLKMLFRPVAMSVPDNELIAEVLLFAEGFRTAKVLAKKVVELFVLSRQLLSAQEHYDWGLRALKTTLTIGGQLIQAEKAVTKELSEEREATLLIKAIRINTLPKLTYSDLKKFVPLVSDIFSGVSVEDITYEELEQAIKETMEELKLEYSESQSRKILQFYEATKQRMGVVLVGPSGCGKSTIWKVLKIAYEKLGQKMVTHVMNPKSMPRQQLLGFMDYDTREWNEGVLTAAARDCVRQPQDYRCWVICDGDIDPEWIESLNSVLDDNHLLTLPTGERISFGDNVNFIFETNDLRFASPATVSRMGMIFMSEEDVDTKRLITSWLKKQSEEDQARMEGWIEDYLPIALDWALMRAENMIVKTTKVGIVNSALSVLRGIKTKAELVYCLVKGLGSNFSTEMRSRLASELFDRCKEVPSDPRLPLNCYYSQSSEGLKAFVAEHESFGTEELGDPSDPPVVRTIGVQRDIQMFKSWLEQGDPFIIVGPEGSGKNLMLRTAFKQLKSTQVATLHCNAQTTASHVLQKLMHICVQSTSTSGKVLRPKESSRLILYLKDINLPTPDKYNTIQLIAFLQQIVTYQGFYDNLDFVYLERVQIVASMNPGSTVGRHELSPRFTANVRVLVVDYPTREELIHVYTQYLKNILREGKDSMSSRLAQSMVEIYQTVKSKFPIDEHRHYLFTPRDLTGWAFGLLRYEGGPGVLEAWGYEGLRVFKDRLVSKEHCMHFDGILNKELRQSLGHNEGVNCYYTTWSATHETKVSWLSALGRVEASDLQTIMSQGLLAYEREFRELHMHIFEESLGNLAKLNRALSIPGGCLLLIGESGAGRRNAALLVSHMLNLEFFSPHITRQYSEKDFRKDLKQYLQAAGVEGKSCVLFLEDYQIVDSTFLQLMNSLIGGGEVPGLYTSEEIDPILAPLADEMRQEGKYRTLYEYFVSRVKKNLRVVLSLDHSHPFYEVYCASNPALYTQCHVLWMQQWSKESLRKVSQIELKEQLEDLPDKSELIELGITVHQSLPKTVQRNFIDLLKAYRKIYGKCFNSQGGQSSHLKAGLGKLQDAENQVQELKKTAEKQKQLLAHKQKEADEALKQITKAMEKAAERRQEMESLQNKLQEDNVKINKRKSEVEVELSDIQPMVDEAQKAVGSIRKESLDELKSLRMPPEPVHDVLSAVLRLMGNYDTSWNSMKDFLKGRSVIPSLMNFDPRLIKPEVRDDVNNLVRKKKNSFEPSIIERASLAAAPMAKWVKALLQYSVILEKIKPLEDDLNQAKKKLESSQKRLEECEQQLTELDNQVEELRDNFARRTSEAEQLKSELKQAEDTLHSAQQLLGKLSGEKDRWEGQLKELQQSLDLMPKHSMLAAGFVTYLSSHPENVRESTIKNWKNSAGTPNFEFRKFMSSESEMLQWKAEGLPGDTLSMENAIVINNAVKTPLIVDPATSASTWLRNQEAADAISQSDAKFTTQLELSVRFGKTLIIQEVDKIEAILFPLLRLDLVKQGPRWTVQIGEKLIDFTETFKLYLCTRDSSIELPSNTKAVLNVVNFTVTRSGLEGQLLSLILNHERPELEQQKTEMLAKEENLKVQLADLEKKLLEELATAEGNLLENKSLIESLNNTKANSNDIGEALNKSHELQASLDEQREVYRELASQGACIYSLLQDLKKTNNMYQYSLSSFLSLFNKSLDLQDPPENLQTKLSVLSRRLVKIIFVYVSRSLFKQDRMMFGLHFVKGIREELFENNEWEFLKGEVAATGDAGRLFPTWAAEDRRDEFGMLGATLPKLVNYIQLDNDQIWKPWGESPQCEVEFPSQAKLTEFQKLLLVKVLRPDRLESAMQRFISDGLGESSVSPPTLSFPEILQESKCEEPILLIVSPGADPTKELEEFAENSIGRDRLHEMAMGGGQNEEALGMLREAAHKGDWVCLKNLHLVTSWLPSLEKELKLVRPHKDFRLWLTTEPHPKFPSILLQTSLKITYESPPGVKKNLQRTYNSWNKDFIEGGNTLRAQALFSLAWFHAIVQERRTYIPQGWSKFYEFSLADLRAGCDLLEQVLSRSSDWSTLRGLLENAVYGGRIDNDFDMKVLSTYLKQYFDDYTFRNGKLSEQVRLPSSQNHQNYKDLIESLPDTDSPEIFGLPLNIGRSVQRFNSSNVIKQLKQLSAVSQEELKFDREEWSAKLGPLWNLWQTLHKPGDKIKGALNDSEDPLESFVFMEANFAFKMLEKVHQSLEGISKVILGTGMLTSKIEQDAKALLQSQVPESWSEIWEGPSSPVSWLRALVRRTNALKKWVEATRNKTLFQQGISPGELFHPQTFLNAYRQMTARELNIPIEQLKLVSSFQSKLGIQLKGILLQGCEFSGSSLTSPSPNSPELTQIPSVNVAWVRQSDSEPTPLDQTVPVPLYTTLDRTQLLATLNLPNSGSPEQRIISGVALFLNGSE